MKKGLLKSFSFLVLFFLYFPIFILILFSFNDSKLNSEWSGFTLKWYASLFDDPNVISAFINSIVVALVTTIVATILGTICAIALHRYAFKFRMFIDGIVYLPILIPDILLGLSLLLLFTTFNMELNQATIIIAHITFCISFVVVIVSARLSGMGKELEDAANDLGATPWQTFRYVTLPNILPGVVASALLTFTLSIDDFVISFFVSGPESTTLPIYIYGLVKRGISPEINALSTILIVVIVVIMILANRFRKGEGGSSNHLPFY